MGKFKRSSYKLHWRMFPVTVFWKVPKMDDLKFVFLMTNQFSVKALLINELNHKLSRIFHKFNSVPIPAAISELTIRLSNFARNRRSSVTSLMIFSPPKSIVQLINSIIPCRIFHGFNFVSILPLKSEIITKVISYSLWSAF